MILAGIDIGTNTLRLLVAETSPDSFQEIYSDRRITRLGQDLDRTGLISPEAADRSLSALIAFNDEISGHSAVRTSAVGTSALRKASNAAEFIATVKQQTGFVINTVSGNEEARLTLLGVAQALREPRRTGRKEWFPVSACVIDIGGGSTEIVTTRYEAAPVISSLPLGAVYLSERFFKHDPPSADEQALLRRAIRTELAAYAARLGSDKPRILIGTAGTVTALASLDLRLETYDPFKINRHEISRQSVDRIVHEISRRSHSELRAMPGLDRGREDIILAGSMIVQELMEQFGHGSILVSDGGLREGIVLDLYERIVNEADRSGS